MRHWLVIAVFGLLLLAPALAGLVGVRAELIENRAPRPLPDWSFAAARDASYFADLDGWLEDRLPLRPQAVALDAFIDYRWLGDSPNPQVLVGRDGWLFMADSLRWPCSQGMTPARNLAALRSLARILARDGRRVFVLVSPNKAFLHADRLPPAGRQLDACGAEARRELRRLLAEPHPSFQVVDLWAPWERARDAGSAMFPALDRHWTDYAGILQTRLLVDAIQPGLAAGAPLIDAGPIAKRGELPHRFMNLEIDETVPGHRLERSGVSTDRTPFMLTPGSRHTSYRSRTTSRDAPLLPGRTLILHDSFMDLSIDSFELYAEEVDYVHWNEVYAHPAAIAQHVAAAQRVVLQLVEDRRVFVLEPSLQPALLRALAQTLRPAADSEAQPPNSPSR